MKTSKISKPIAIDTTDSPASKPPEDCSLTQKGVKEDESDHTKTLSGIQGSESKDSKPKKKKNKSEKKKSKKAKKSKDDPPPEDEPSLEKPSKAIEPKIEEASRSIEESVMSHISSSKRNSLVPSRLNEDIKTAEISNSLPKESKATSDGKQTESSFASGLFSRLRSLSRRNSSVVSHAPIPDLIVQMPKEEDGYLARKLSTADKDTHATKALQEESNDPLDEQTVNVSERSRRNSTNNTLSRDILEMNLKNEALLHPKIASRRNSINLEENKDEASTNNHQIKTDELPLKINEKDILLTDSGLFDKQTIGEIKQIELNPDPKIPTSRSHSFYSLESESCEIQKPKSSPSPLKKLWSRRNSLILPKPEEEIPKTLDAKVCNMSRKNSLIIRHNLTPSIDDPKDLEPDRLQPIKNVSRRNSFIESLHRLLGNDSKSKDEDDEANRKETEEENPASPKIVQNNNSSEDSNDVHEAKEEVIVPKVIKTLPEVQIKATKRRRKSSVKLTTTDKSRRRENSIDVLKENKLVENDVPQEIQDKSTQNHSVAIQEKPSSRKSSLIKPSEALNGSIPSQKNSENVLKPLEDSQDHPPKEEEDPKGKIAGVFQENHSPPKSSSMAEPDLAPPEQHPESRKGSKQLESSPEGCIEAFNHEDKTGHIYSTTKLTTISRRCSLKAMELSMLQCSSKYRSKSFDSSNESKSNEANETQSVKVSSKKKKEALPSRRECDAKGLESMQQEVQALLKKTPTKMEKVEFLQTLLKSIADEKTDESSSTSSEPSIDDIEPTLGNVKKATELPEEPTEEEELIVENPPLVLSSQNQDIEIIVSEDVVSESGEADKSIITESQGSCKESSLGKIEDINYETEDETDSSITSDESISDNSEDTQTQPLDSNLTEEKTEVTMNEDAEEIRSTEIEKASHEHSEVIETKAYEIDEEDANKSSNEDNTSSTDSLSGESSEDDSDSNEEEYLSKSLVVEDRYLLPCVDEEFAAQDIDIISRKSDSSDISSDSSTSDNDSFSSSSADDTSVSSEEEEEEREFVSKTEHSLEHDISSGLEKAMESIETLAILQKRLSVDLESIKIHHPPEINEWHSKEPTNEEEEEIYPESVGTDVQSSYFDDKSVDAETTLIATKSSPQSRKSSVISNGSVHGKVDCKDACSVLKEKSVLMEKGLEIVTPLKEVFTVVENISTKNDDHAIVQESAAEIIQHTVAKEDETKKALDKILLLMEKLARRSSILKEDVEIRKQESTSTKEGSQALADINQDSITPNNHCRSRRSSTSGSMSLSRKSSIAGQRTESGRSSVSGQKSESRKSSIGVLRPESRRSSAIGQLSGSRKTSLVGLKPESRKSSLVGLKPESRKSSFVAQRVDSRKSSVGGLKADSNKSSISESRRSSIFGAKTDSPIDSKSASRRSSVLESSMPNFKSRKSSLSIENAVQERRNSSSLLQLPIIGRPLSSCSSKGNAVASSLGIETPERRSSLISVSSKTGEQRSGSSCSSFKEPPVRRKSSFRDDVGTLNANGESIPSSRRHSTVSFGSDVQIKVDDQESILEESLHESEKESLKRPSLLETKAEEDGEAESPKDIAKEVEVALENIMEMKSTMAKMMALLEKTSLGGDKRTTNDTDSVRSLISQISLYSEMVQDIMPVIIEKECSDEPEYKGSPCSSDIFDESHMTMEEMNEKVEPERNVKRDVLPLGTAVDEKMKYFESMCRSSPFNAASSTNMDGEDEGRAPPIVSAGVSEDSLLPVSKQRQVFEREALKAMFEEVSLHKVVVAAPGKVSDHTDFAPWVLPKQHHAPLSDNFTSNPFIQNDPVHKRARSTHDLSSREEHGSSCGRCKRHTLTSGIGSEVSRSSINISSGSPVLIIKVQDAESQTLEDEFDNGILYEDYSRSPYVEKGGEVEIMEPFLDSSTLPNEEIQEQTSQVEEVQMSENEYSAHDPVSQCNDEIPEAEDIASMGDEAHISLNTETIMEEESKTFIPSSSTHKIDKIKDISLTPNLPRRHSESNLKKGLFKLSVSMDDIDNTDSFTISFEGTNINICSSSTFLAKSNIDISKNNSGTHLTLRPHIKKKKSLSSIFSVSNEELPSKSIEEEEPQEDGNVESGGEDTQDSESIPETVIERAKDFPKEKFELELPPSRLYYFDEEGSFEPKDEEAPFFGLQELDSSPNPLSPSEVLDDEQADHEGASNETLSSLLNSVRVSPDKFDIDDREFHEEEFDFEEGEEDDYESNELDELEDGGAALGKYTRLNRRPLPSRPRKFLRFSSQACGSNKESLEATKESKLFKILFIGSSSAGKTSIIRRYVKHTFTPTYRATIGADFLSKVVEWDEAISLRLQLWDIAGQDRFSLLSRSFYKDAVGAFIVCDIARGETLDACVPWKEELDDKVHNANGGKIPCFLLANKCDLVEDSTAQSKLYSKMAQQHNFQGWIQTSAKEDINITQAIEMLLRQIIKQDVDSTPVATDHESLVLQPDGRKRKRTGCLC